MASLRPTTEGQPSIHQTDKAFGGEGCLFAGSGWGDSTLSTKNEGGAITGGVRHKILEYMVQSKKSQKHNLLLEDAWLPGSSDETVED